MAQSTWNPETITIEATKYSRRIDFKKANFAAYIKAYRLGILDEVCDHMKKKWTFETIQDAAREFYTTKEFYEKQPGAYAAAQRMGFLEEITSCMVNNRKSGRRDKWNVDLIRKILPKYNSISEFAKNKLRAYQKALALGMGEELHEFYNSKPFFWTPEKNNELIKLKNLNYTPEQIGKMLDKSTKDIIKKIYKLREQGVKIKSPRSKIVCLLP